MRNTVDINFSIYLSISRSNSPSISRYQFIYHLPIYPSIYLSVYLYECISIPKDRERGAEQVQPPSLRPSPGRPSPLRDANFPSAIEGRRRRRPDVQRHSDPHSEWHHLYRANAITSWLDLRLKQIFPSTNSASSCSLSSFPSLYSRALHILVIAFKAA